MKEIFVLLADLDLRAWFRPPGRPPVRACRLLRPSIPHQQARRPWSHDAWTLRSQRIVPVPARLSGTV